MEDPIDRLYLYTLSAQGPVARETFSKSFVALTLCAVALQNEAIPQAESLFKAAVTHFAEIPPVLGTQCLLLFFFFG